MIEIIAIQTIAGAIVVASVGIAAALAWKSRNRREISEARPLPAALGDRGSES